MSESYAPASSAGLPRVSVVMPVYNASSYLEAAVASILEQSWHDFELICVDDGSRDNCLSILQGFQSRDARVRILSRPNTGIVGALNDGVALARGEFIARMDADDIAVPERLKIQVAFLEAHPAVVCVGSRARYIDSDDDPTGVWRVPLEHDGIESYHIKEGLGGGIIHPAAMIRRQTLLDIGGYRPGTELAEDLDLWLRLGEIGKLANLPAILLNYRIVSEGLTMSRRADQDRKVREVVNVARKRRGLEPLSAPLAQWTPNEVSQLRVILFRARGDGYWKSARKYAWRLIKKTPSARHGWQILIQASVHLVFFPQAENRQLLRQTS